jgi:hypothetical protein
MIRSPFGLDMSKHTSHAEPISQKANANREERGDATEDDSDLSEDPDDNTAEEMVQDLGSGFGWTAWAFARALMNLSLAVATGFHYAPLLYGDTTVQRFVNSGSAAGDLLTSIQTCTPHWLQIWPKSCWKRVHIWYLRWLQWYHRVTICWSA